MLTKKQKQEIVSKIKKQIQKSKNMLLVGFAKVGTPKINELKSELKKSGAKFVVVKKRLLNIAAKELGINLDIGKSDVNFAVIFNQEDLSAIAGPVYKISKLLEREKKILLIKCGYDLEHGNAISGQDFIDIAKLPPREVLLAQLVGTISSPIRKLLLIIKGRQEKLSVS